MRIKSFFKSEYMGQTIYRCPSCKYDTFYRENIEQHASRMHQPVEVPDRMPKTRELDGKRVLISLLSWENGDVALESSKRIEQEKEILLGMGAYVTMVWVDNGSRGQSAIRNAPKCWWTIRNLENLGSSVARNQALDVGLEAGADVWIMIDADIIPIPGSIQAMTRALLRYAPAKLGCLGLYSENCTHDRADSDIDTLMTEIPGTCLRGDPFIGWTQYGAFSMEPFRQGARFEEEGPFNGPGWGFEDDDIGMQIANFGYGILFTPLFRYLHIKRNSSIHKIGKTLAAKLFTERQKFIMHKWEGCETEDVKRRLALIANQGIPEFLP